jgi:O-antigen/teichoic acid export membrane protein
LLPYAVPLGVICVAGAFSPTLERTLTDRLLGAQELGLYAAAAKVAMLVGLLVGAFQTAWGPFSLSIHRQLDAARTYNQVLRFFTLAMCIAVLGLMLVSGLIIGVLASDRYSSAAIAVFPLAMGLVVQATSWITELGIGLSKRSHLNLFPYCVSLAVTLGGDTCLLAVAFCCEARLLALALVSLALLCLLAAQSFGFALCCPTIGLCFFLSRLTTLFVLGFFRLATFFVLNFLHLATFVLCCPLGLAATEFFDLATFGSSLLLQGYFLGQGLLLKCNLLG